MLRYIFNESDGTKVLTVCFGSSTYAVIIAYRGRIEWETKIPFNKDMIEEVFSVMRTLGMIK